MKELNAIVFDKVKYERELNDFEQMLNAHTSHWRHQHLIVDSKQIHIITFDELLASLKAQPPRF